MKIDGVDITLDAKLSRFFAPIDFEANETFVKIVEQVRGRMDDDDIAYVAEGAWQAGDWTLGLWELLGEVYAAGLSLPDELLDKALETPDPHAAMGQIVEYLRARNRELAPA